MQSRAVRAEVSVNNMSDRLDNTTEEALQSAQKEADTAREDLAKANNNIALLTNLIVKWVPLDERKKYLTLAEDGTPVL